MKKLDDAIRRFGFNEGGYTAHPSLKKVEVPAVLHNGGPLTINQLILDGHLEPMRSQADTIALQKMEIEALNKLLNERDELLDSLVNSPSELGGWVCCLVLIICVFVAHGLGYM